MTIDLILDCQFGSTGKGLFASYLAERHAPDVIAYAPSPNAGHTFYHNGQEVIHKMLPSGVTSPDLRTIVLGPGSLLDLDRLYREITRLGDCGIPCPAILIHENAAIVQDRHREAESKGEGAPGSTRQGTGEAQAERILRKKDGDPILAKDMTLQDSVRIIGTAEMQQVYYRAKRLQVESAQGYSLSIYHGDYPHVTCRDVTTASILSDTGVPIMRQMNVYGTFRTYPIRVANRDGRSSGPCYDDSKEVSFASLGLKQELTTVTKLPRRIFTWSQQQAIEACNQNRVNSAFLNFAQYPPTFAELRHIWHSLSEGTNVQYLGFGPTASDVYRVGDPSIDFARVEKLWRRYRTAAGLDC
ncbi:MAG: adenylosuccinate synthetase [Synechococcus sp.]